MSVTGSEKLAEGPEGRRFDIAQLGEACQTAIAGAGHAALLSNVSRCVPDLDFRLILTRTGWHRPVGVITADGTRISHNLRQWAESESDGDIFTLIEKYGDSGYLATRFDGKTHYFTAPCGKGAVDFVQLEVEEVREVVDRPLFHEDYIPDDIEEFLDPTAAPKTDIEHKPLSEPRYFFQRITDIADLVAEHASSAESDRRYLRFLEEWDRSSAGAHCVFCDHWVLRLFQFTDRFGEHKIEATPLPAQDAAIPSSAADEPRGAALANLIQGFDKAAGFPMAWYFHMLVKKKELTQLPAAVYADHLGEFRYLPERDLAILDNWVKQPYSF